jgi:hypothetical protein
MDGCNLPAHKNSFKFQCMQVAIRRTVKGCSADHEDIYDSVVLKTRKIMNECLESLVDQNLAELDFSMVGCFDEPHG